MRKLKGYLKETGLIGGPILMGVIMILSVFAGQVAATTSILGFTDETPRSNNLIGGAFAPQDTISVIGINLITDTADTLVSIDVDFTSVTTFDGSDLATVDLYRDSPGV